MMHNLIRKSCTLSLGGAPFDWFAFLGGLAHDGFVGAIYATKNELIDRFGLTGDKVDPRDLYPKGAKVYGDLFFPDRQTTLYLKTSYATGEPEGDVTDANVWEDPGKAEGMAPQAVTIEIGEISSLTEDEGKHLAAFMKAVAKNFGAQKIKEKDMGWAEVGAGAATAPPFDAEPAKAPDAFSLELAAVFRDGKLGEFLDQFSGDTESVVLDDYLALVSNREETEYYIDKLFEYDFLAEEIVVSCRKTGAATIRAKDRAALDALAEAGIRCSCGQPLQSELVRRLILLPEKSRPYVAPNWAARTFLVNLLLKMGFRDANLFLSTALPELQLAFVASGERPLVVAMAAGRFDDQAVKTLWSALGKHAEQFHVILYGAHGLDDGAVAKVSGRLGEEKVLALASLDDFNTKLLDRLGAERLASVMAVLEEFRRLMDVNVPRLALARLNA